MTTQIIPTIKHIKQTDQNKQRKKPSSEILSPVLPISGSKDACYKGALLLVARIDDDLTQGARHYRTKAGELLTTLDQVVTAILSSSLMEPEG